MFHDVAAPPEKAMRTAVLVCESLADLNLEELCSSLEAACPEVAVEVVPDLCGHPARLPPVVARRGSVRAVLGLCSSEYSQVELQAQARKAGLDPFGLEVVPLGTLCARVHPQPQANRKAQELLAAAVARARAFPGSGPEHSKLYFLSMSQRVSRRSLFTVPPIGYRPVPSILGRQCVAEAGCQLCARACPRDALWKAVGQILLDKTRCEGCGVCLGVCPREAIDFPGWSLPQFEAQLAALLGSATPGGEPLGLLLTCQGALGKLEELAHQGISYSHRWLPVTVPCLGMVTPTWVLQALAHGAQAVALLPCESGCSFGQWQTIESRADFCQRLLGRLGQWSERLLTIPGESPEQLTQDLRKAPRRDRGIHHAKPEEPMRLSSLEATSKAIRRLVEGTPNEVALEHPHSPFGVVEFKGESCTACLACVEACPTGALSSERSDDSVALTWLAASCSGCGMCADVCPESAAQTLRVRRTTDLDVLSRRRVVLHRDRLLTCEGCGGPIGSEALLQRLTGALEGDNEALHAALGRYCPSCRGPIAWRAEPSSVQDTAMLLGPEGRGQNRNIGNT